MSRLQRNNARWGVRAFILLVYDVIAINIASVCALMFRFDFLISSIPYEYWTGYYKYAIANTVIGIAIFYMARMYHSLWVFASVNELCNATVGCLATVLVGYMIHTVTGTRMPRSYYPLWFVNLVVMVIIIRFSYRLLRHIRYERYRSATVGFRNVMIVGAGAAGKVIADEIAMKPELKFKLKCFVDDMPSKRGRLINGTYVAGTIDDIEALVTKYGIEVIMVAIPSLTGKRRQEILQICHHTQCEVRALNSLANQISDRLGIDQMRRIDIQELIGRPQIEIDCEDIAAYVHDKVVLVTGGGGSIGSELCRQIASHHPRQLIILDIYENNAYDIQQELIKKYPTLDFVVLIGSVRNTHRINSIFEQYRPEIVYHAAAHKHVPLMEDSPNEAIKNNVFGTYKTAEAAARYGVKRFVLISTDKAVNPTNIMGASKRLCEMIVQMMNRRYTTEYVAVRFGNVLGSNGSVVPLFQKQIQAGGPVTVTHKDIVRYFMTISEAVSLVLQAGAYAKGGEIFVLDMGEPVRIDDLARNMIRLSGHIPDVDMKIEYTGLRPGEKLYEEMLMSEEGLLNTENALIHIGKPIEMNDEQFMTQLEELKAACEADDGSIKYAVSRIVTTYRVGRE